MQTTSSRFQELATGYVRPLSYATRASFDKVFDTDVTFFTLDTSVLDGTDILAPSDDNPLQEWDKYAYVDYTGKTKSIEITREETEPYSVVQAFADIVLNNYDSYFTPNSGSPIEEYILPRRPFRALLGFGGETVPQIVGMSEGMPELDKASRTASFHVVDFMTLLLAQDIGETVILENVKTHEVLDYLLQYMGLTDDQYTLDDSLNTIKFFYVEKGAKFRGILEKLIEAEIGRFYMDEAGILRFKNRYSYDLTPVYTFDKSNTIDYAVSDIDRIINSVKITNDVREVQIEQSVWTGSSPDEIGSGQTIEIWAQFNDPVTTLNDPVYSAVEINDSYFIASLAADGTGAYSDMDLVSLDLFSTSAKMVFENTGASAAYITAIDLYGTPAKIIDSIKVEEKDQASIDDFEEQLYEISDNPYIQDRSNAQARAIMLINDYKNYGSSVDLEVKGNPAIQLADAVNLDLDGYQGVYTIIKTVSIMSEGKLTSRLRARQKVVASFFILDTSILDGTDVLSP